MKQASSWKSNCSSPPFSDDKVETGEEKGEPTVAAENCDGNADEDLLGPNCYYDKSKSFFDNISSELKSR